MVLREQPLEPADAVLPESSLANALTVLRRRKWIVVVCVLLVPLVAVTVALRQETMYQATAQVLLSDLNLATTLTGVQNPSGTLQPDRQATTQVALARVPRVAALALEAAGGRGESVQDFLRATSVSAATNADILAFTVSDHNQKRASALATAYGQAYISYRRQLATAALEVARIDVERRLVDLKGNPAKRGLVTSLEATDQKLRTMEALQTSSAFLVEPAGRAQQTAPQLRRVGMLGLGLGIVLGVGLAFLGDGLDIRVRSLDEISKLLEMSLLGRIPGTRARSRGRRLVMLDDPASLNAESYRVLRTNVELANVDIGARMILITSALEAEGKSETAANLAIAIARAGKHAILVDLDLRKPSLATIFEHEHPFGIADVAVGTASLDDALTAVRLENSTLELWASGAPKASSKGKEPTGILELLLAGSIPANPGEFIGTHTLGRILADVRGRADVVIVDSPPLLQVSDGLVLSRRVDGVIAVVDMRSAQRKTLKELRRVLEALPTPTLGFVVTGDDDELSHGRQSYGRLHSERDAAETPNAMGVGLAE